MLLASKGRGASGGPAHTAQDLARNIARELLGPLLETACSRLASLLRHAFDIAADSQQLLQGELKGRVLSLLLNFAYATTLLPRLHPVFLTVEHKPNISQATKLENCRFDKQGQEQELTCLKYCRSQS